ncbi:MAG: hypothetical protein H6830_04525 [Planctomycetes bacterium]|nr:hypothetical protein [Planctomycetota bacterium]MCB9912635.1 hypothetical protein [Planctomycetota bacterium]
MIVTPGGAYLFLARIYLDDGLTLLTPDLPRLVTLRVRSDYDGGVVRQLPLRPDECLLDGLRTDDDWTWDTIGYQFRHRLFPDLISNPGVRYTVEYEFTLLGDTPEIPLYLHRETFSVLAGPAL